MTLTTCSLYKCPSDYISTFKIIYIFFLLYSSVKERNDINDTTSVVIYYTYTHAYIHTLILYYTLQNNCINISNTISLTMTIVVIIFFNIKYYIQFSFVFMKLFNICYNKLRKYEIIFFVIYYHIKYFKNLYFKGRGYSFF